MHLNLDQLGFRKGLFLAFLVGFAFRLIPEILSYPNPIGFDTVYYAARMKNGLIWSHWTSVFDTWLIYALLIPLYSLTKVEPFLLLKVVAPLLYGGSAAGIYYFASKGLGWNVTKGLLASGFFAVQLAALGISWHFYRNILGLTILLFTIPLLKKNESWKDIALLSSLSLLVVWGHELASVTLFAAVAGLTAISLIKKEQIPYRLFVAVTPAFLVFFGNLYFRAFPLHINLESNILLVSDRIAPHPGGLFFLVDYLKVLNPIEHYASYSELFSHVISLFLLLYAVMLPLIAVGHFRDRVLSSWTLLLMIGSFGCLIMPFSALLYWNRWMLMLVYPFTFYAVNGMWKILKRGEAFSTSRFLGWFKLTRKFALGLTLLSIVIGTLFMSWPLIDGKYGLIGTENTFKYIPSTMQSSSVPLRDTQGTIEAFGWLNENMSSDSSVLIHDVFQFWTMLYLEKNHTAIFFDNNFEEASNLAFTNGATTAYFVWWNEDSGWYNFELPQDCVSVFDSGRISVFQVI